MFIKSTLSKEQLVKKLEEESSLPPSLSPSLSPLFNDSSDSEQSVKENMYRLFIVMTIDCVSQKIISLVYFPLNLENEFKDFQFLCSHNYVLIILNDIVNIYERDKSEDWYEIGEKDSSLNKFKLSSSPIFKNIHTGITMNKCGTSILINDSSEENQVTKLVDLKTRTILYEKRLIDAYIKSSGENNYFIPHKHGYILLNGITGEVIHDIELELDFPPSCNISVDETKTMIIDSDGNKIITDLKSRNNMKVAIPVQSSLSLIRDWIYSSPNFERFAYEYRDTNNHLSIYNDHEEKVSDIILPVPHIRHFLSDSYMIDYKEGRVSLINIKTREVKETEILNSAFPVHVDDMCICMSNTHSKAHIILPDSSYITIKIPKISDLCFKPFYKIVRVIETSLPSKTRISYYKNSLYL
jgi:hypothetical protein